ncbi:MAG: recombinase family protein, partial [Planctomycetales bacterium]
MLRNKFDPDRPYPCVKYLRMSDPGQNKRSPEQQNDMIDGCLERLQRPWRIAKTYKDEGKSGRLRNRPGYMQMMRDLKSGAVPADLILVDTVERFGRVEELSEIRRNLRQQHGILVLAADSYFADPTSPQGRAHALMEDFRASEDGRIKAHNVLRGKYDSIKRGPVPFGPVPFGFALELVDTEYRKGRRVDHHKLVPNADKSRIIQRLFNKASEPNPLGQTRLARWLNEAPDVPDRFKPFHGPTVGYWLDNSIYYGELVWDQYATGIVADVRVLEPNDDKDVLRVPDFCQGIVSRESWDRVQETRQLRRKRLLAARNGEQGTEDEKLIQASA